MPTQTPRGYPVLLGGDRPDFPAYLPDLAVAIDTDVAGVEARLDDLEGIAAGGGPRARMLTLASQSFPASTTTRVGPWSARAGLGDQGDSNGIAHNAGLLTFTSPGLYLVALQYTLVSGGTLHLRRNGAIVYTLNANSNSPVGPYTTLIQIAAGDTLDFAVVTAGTSGSFRTALLDVARIGA